VLGVIAAEEGATDAAGDAVEAAGGAVVDQVFTGHRHGGRTGSQWTHIKWHLFLRDREERKEEASDACPHMSVLGSSCLSLDRR